MIQTLIVWPLLRVILAMWITTHQLLVLNLVTGLPHQIVHVSSVYATAIIINYELRPFFPALCMVLPLLVNGGYIKYTNLPNKLIAGTEASYECDQGFLIDPENGLTRTCLIDGTWSGMSSTCSESTAYHTVL